MSYNFNSIASVPPTGTVAPFTGTTDPSGWAICDGISRSNASGQYNNLINAALINQNSYGTNSVVPYSFQIVRTTGNSIACSADGRVVIVSITNSSNQGGYPYISRDYGITYTRLTASNFIGQTLNTTSLASYLKVSSNGNNIAIRQGNDYFSSNSGNTFFSTSSVNGYGISCSSDLKYITAANNVTLYLSSTYGMSFYLCSTFNSKKTSVGGGILGGTGVCISDNGLTLMHAWYNSSDYVVMIYSLDGGTTWLNSAEFTGTGIKTKIFNGGISPNGQIWLVTNYLSTDAGNTWKYYPSFGGSAQEVYILNDNLTILYSYNYNGTFVFKTTDYGTTTQTLLTGILNIAIVQSVANYSTFYITGGKKTTDDGNTFTRPDTSSLYYLPATYNFNQIATSQNGQLILAGNNSGYLYLSTNRGNTWAIQNKSLSANWYTASMSATNGQFMLAGNNSFLYLSTNTGATWQPVSGSAYGSTYGLFTTTGNWSCTAISNAGQYMLAGMNTGNLYLSTSSGSSWTLLGGADNTNGMPTTEVNWSSCSMNSSGSFMSACVSTGAVYLSTDSGTNWSTAPGLSISSPWSKVSIASSANYVLAAENSGNIYLSTDGAGATWMSKSGTSAPANMPTSAQAWQSLAISGDGTKLIAGTNSSIIYASTTSGQTWTNLGGASNTLGLPNAATSNWQSMTISQDGSTWLADVNGAQLYISTDGFGKLWGIKSNYNVLGTGTWNALTISQDGTTVLAGNTASNLYVSYDSGNTYNALSSNGNLSGTKNWTGAAISQNNQIMAACAMGDYNYLSSNGGLTWSNQVNASISTNGLPTGTSSWQTLSMDSTGQYQIAGINPGYLFYTNNYGNNWSTLSGPSLITGINNTNGLPTSSSAWNTTKINSTGQYVLAGISGGALYISTNTFTTWTAISGVNGATTYGMTTNSLAWQTTAMNSTGQYMLAGTNNTVLYLSTNSGSYWNIIAGQAYSNAAYGQGLPTVTGSWYTSAISSTGQYMATGLYGGAFYFSQNYGQKWTAYSNSPLSNSLNWQSMSMSSNGSAIVASANASNVYNITTYPTATYTPPQISGTTSTDGTTLNYIIKL